MGKLYKVLGADDRPIYGRGEYSLPCNGCPGAWMPAVEGQLRRCQNGYRLCTIEQLPRHLESRIYEAEGQGDCIEYETEIVYRKARLLRLCGGWNERSARIFACDCAERVVHLYEREHPDDTRPRDAISVARRYAHGEATREELGAARATAKAAARAAAWDAAGATAWAAAGDASWAAAWDAAWAAAGDASWATAWAAAGDAERQWQSERLAEILNGGGQ